MLAVGSALLIQYICLRYNGNSFVLDGECHSCSSLRRSLGLSTVTAYNRAKVFSLHIVNLGGRRRPSAAEADAHTLRSFGPLPQSRL